MPLCRNCCRACRGNVPKTWTVEIDSVEYTLNRARVSLFEGSSTGHCYWNVALPEGIDGYSTARWLEFRISVAGVPTLDSETFCHAFLLTEDFEVEETWDNNGEQWPANCMEEKVLTDGPFTLTFTPGPLSRCDCPCDSCCDQCSSGQYTAKRWVVEIDGHEFTVPRRVRQDEPEDGFDSEVCIWSKRISTELFGTMAKDLIIRIWTYDSGSGIPLYNVWVELFKEDDTRHTLWARQLTTMTNCGATISTIIYADGEGSSQGTVELEPLSLKYCPTIEGSQADCHCCETGTTCERYRIEISGVNDAPGSPCSGSFDCDDFNGTYWVERDFSVPGCRWSMELEEPIGDVTTIIMGIVCSWEGTSAGVGFLDSEGNGVGGPTFASFIGGFGSANCNGFMLPNQNTPGLCCLDGTAVIACDEEE